MHPWRFLGGCIYLLIYVDWKVYGCFLKWWYLQNTPKWSFLVGKPMVVGYRYHHFRNPPYGFGPHFFSKGKTSVTQFRHKTFRGSSFPWRSLRMIGCIRIRGAPCWGKRWPWVSNLWDSMVWKSCHDFLVKTPCFGLKAQEVLSYLQLLCVFCYKWRDSSCWCPSNYLGMMLEISGEEIGSLNQGDSGKLMAWT